MRASGTPDVVCLGILVADSIARPVHSLPPSGTLALVDEISLHGGGGALNTATALMRLGLGVAVVGKVGTDAFGNFLLGLLDERGVDDRGVIRDPAAATSATVVLVDSEGERTFLHVPGANGVLREADVDLERVLAGRALHIAGSLVLPELDGEPTARILAAASERGILTALDTVYDASGRWERVLPALPHLDLITPGLAEGRAISGEHEPDRVAAWFRRRGVGAVAVTMGADGSYVAGDDFEGEIAPVKVRAVDGTGCGDAFAAGLIYGTLANWGLERAARFANALGALASTAVGAVDGVPSLEQALSFAGLEPGLG